MSMSRYLVKNKYTYEKVRQTDYTYSPDKWVISQNHEAGRFIFEAAEPICALTLQNGASPVEIMLTPAQSARFSEVSGFMLSQGKGEGMLCRVTLWGENGESFCSVVYMTEEPRLLSTLKMDFTPVRMTLEVRPFDPVWDVPTVDVTLTYGYVLNTLGEVGGQSHFYAVEGGTLTDNGGALVWGLKGGAGLTAPVFPDNSDTVYNMVMPLRNTVFMVITNKSTAKMLNLTWATTTHPWEESGAVAVELAQDSEPHAYYFNLSGVPRCCDGRMAQFSLYAQGEGEKTLPQRGNRWQLQKR